MSEALRHGTSEILTWDLEGGIVEFRPPWFNGTAYVSAQFAADPTFTASREYDRRWGWSTEYDVEWQIEIVRSHVLATDGDRFLEFFDHGATENLIGDHLWTFESEDAIRRHEDGLRDYY